MSSLIFRAASGKFSVWSCHCGCDLAVEVTPLMEDEVTNHVYYVRSHQYLGAAIEHIGRRYDFEAPWETIEEFSDLPPPETLPSQTKSNLDETEASGDVWGEATPTTDPWWDDVLKNFKLDDSDD